MSEKKTAADFVAYDEETGAATITLSRAIDLAGAKVSALSMREPTVNDQLVADKVQGDAAKEISLFANLCQLTPEDIRKLPLRDYKRVQAAYMGFAE